MALRQPSVWRRAVTLGLSVGMLQAAINNGDHWLARAVDGRVLAKSIISPLIGFTLVLFSAAATWVERTLERRANERPPLHDAGDESKPAALTTG